MLAVVVTVAVNILWYLPLVIRQGKKDAAPKKYTIFAIILGLTLGIVVGAVFTIAGGNFIQSVLGIDKDTVLYLFVYTLICAGFAEEASKFLCGGLFIKLAKPVRKLDYLLILGGAGFGFSVTENILYGLTSGAAAVIRALLPLHIMWQLRMGGHYYESVKARNNGNKSLACKELFAALVIPVVMHGLYDMAAMLPTKIVQDIGGNADNMSAVQEIVCIACFAMILFSFVYCIVTEVWASRMVKESRTADIIESE